MHFSPKRVGETEVFTVDYTGRLAPGETIASAVWTNSVVDGVDASPSNMIQGSATINGPKVSQLITAGLVGPTYAPICTAQTSLGQTLILPDPGTGFLTVVP